MWHGSRNTAARADSEVVAPEHLSFVVGCRRWMLSTREVIYSRLWRRDLVLYPVVRAERTVRLYLETLSFYAI